MSEPVREVNHYDKGKRLYEAIDARGEIDTVDDMPVKMFTGSIIEVYKNVRPKLSMSDYGRLFRGLKQTGSITLLQKGARNTNTIMALHHPPTPEQWQAYERSPLTRKLASGNLSSELADLRKEVETLRTRLNQVVQLNGLQDAGEQETPTQT